MQLDSDSLCTNLRGSCRTLRSRDRLLNPENGEILVQAPPSFDAAPHWPRPRGPKGAHLKEESKRNRFLLYSALIRVLGAEQSAPKDRQKFSEKRVKMSTAVDISKGADILTHLDRSCQYKHAGTVRQTRRPYKLGRSESRSHLGTAWRRGNTIRERALQGD